MNSPRDVGVLIAAAGQGIRVGGSEPKQFRKIAGVPMLLRAMDPFLAHHRVAQVVVALPESTVSTPPGWLGVGLDERVQLVAGGETRAHSVQAALNALEATCCIVLVHDAARPFVSAETIDAVISVAAQSGALPAVPVSDTIKRGDEASGLVLETIDRRGLWRAQTPQGCPKDILEKAYETAGPSGFQDYTDESSLLEAAGFEVVLVPDTAANFKVTTEDDIRIAEALLHR